MGSHYYCLSRGTLFGDQARRDPPDATELSDTQALKGLPLQAAKNPTEWLMLGRALGFLEAAKASNRARLWKKPRSKLSRCNELKSRCFLDQKEKFREPVCRDPYIIHLNIALSMVVSLDFGGKNMFQKGKMYLLRSPVLPRQFLLAQPLRWKQV